MSNKTVGRAGRDAEFLTTRTRKPMAKFSLAKKDGTWIDIVGFDEVAEHMMDVVRKGALVTVEGDERDNSYTNRMGEKITKRQIIAQSVIVAGAVPVPDDDIPF
jgi:single-stranded DNA-binding protein